MIMYCSIIFEFEFFLNTGFNKSGGDLNFQKPSVSHGPSGSSTSLTIEEAVGHRRVGSMSMEQMQQEIQRLNKKLLVSYISLSVLTIQIIILYAIEINLYIYKMSI